MSVPTPVTNPKRSTQPGTSLLRRGLSNPNSTTKVTAGYLVFGLLSILLAESFFSVIGLPAAPLWPTVVKAVFYVALSTTVVYFLVRREERSSRRSLGLLQAVLDGAPDAVFVKDREGRFLLLNAAGLEFVGKPIEEIIGRDASVIFDAEAARRAKEYDQRVMESGTPAMNEMQVLTNGVSRTFQTIIAPYRDEAGKVVGVVGIARDVTERRQEEERLRLFRALIDEVPDTIEVIDSRTGRFLDVNEAACRAHGYTRDEYLTRTVMDIDPRVGSIGWASAAARVQPTGISILNSVHRRRDGSTFPVEVKLVNVTLSRPYMVAVVRDVTERERVARSLQESEARFAGFMRHLPGLAWIKDDAGRYVFANEAILTAFGRTRDEMLGRDDNELLPPETATKFRENDRLARKRGSVSTTEYLTHPNGRRRVSYVCKFTIPVGTGGTPLLGGVAVDITDLKEAEEELHKTTELFQALVEGITDAVFVKDREGKYLLFNDGASRCVGLPVSEVLGHDDKALFEPESARFLIESDRKVMTSERVTTEEQTITAAGVTRTYLTTKGPYRDAEGHVIGVLGIARDITERKRVEADLWLRDRAIGELSQGLILTDSNAPDNSVIYVSPGFERLTGYTKEEAVGKNCRFLQGPDTDPATVAQLRAAVRNQSACSVGLWNYRKDGTRFWNEISVSPVRNSSGVVTHFVGVQHDGTSRRALEERLRQAQKMEAIGLLAGGVAHDFNNLLTVINGYTDLLIAETPPVDLRNDRLTQIREAVDRAAGLTAQLLAFSRKSLVTPKVLDLNELVDHLCMMLHRLIGEDIILTLGLTPGLSRIKADPGQLEQVVVNLAVNARDAMPRGGRLRIETTEVELGVDALPSSELRPGRFVRLTVTDNGSGMSPEVQSRIFEPFFTTKELGKGTGLGLATVYGILQQAGGHIGVVSVVGRGTTFTILLPATPNEAGQQSTLQNTTPTRGTETVLIVEDEETLCRFFRLTLEIQGYTVVTAANGAEAITLLDNHKGAIDLVVTDVVMPNVGGRELVEAVRERRPTMRVLYMSGYTEDAVVRHGIETSAEMFLQKPFTLLEFAHKVREVLDRSNI